MTETLANIWNFVLVGTPGEQPITVGQIASVLILLAGGYYGARLLGYILRRRLRQSTLRPDLIQTLERIAFFTILVLVVITALSLLGIPLTAFAFATGALAIGIGFGAQNIINNFISGWILMAERPIRIDDYIEIDDWQGVIERVGNRSTRIRRNDGVHLLVPNSQLLERTVVNWTLVDRQIRTTLRVGVEYGSPVRRVSELIMRAISEHSQVRTDPQPTVIFEDFGDNALVFDAYFWCDVTGERLLRQIRSDIRYHLTELFAAESIVVAYPQRDVHLDSSAPLEIRLLQGEEAVSAAYN